MKNSAVAIGSAPASIAIPPNHRIGDLVRNRLLLLALALNTQASATAIAQEVVRREYAIKAGVIGVLAKFVSWPDKDAPAPGHPLTIGILGKDPFVESGVNQLDRMVAEAKRRGSIFTVKRFKSSKDYEPCHILIVSSLAAEQDAEQTAEDRLAAAEKLVAGKSVLIIGESDGLAREGAAANLVFDPVTNLIRLEINPDAAAHAGLRLAPDLLRLKLVQIVRDARD